ncbi:hypothetical protein DPMN_025782 [Dreissena polymorpha]|uniref:Uncharacterized protein n=1 Tax=Dreissena polymorpha TaxID=45954 RepID=A0A9D4LPW3_DREPO|nr:hypothetical protein DPMN_025782 [Dreissena polymorpha]
MQFTTRDGGYGNVQKSASLSLKVKVTRNRNPPSWLTFFNSPVDISENLVLTTPVATLQISDLDLQVSFTVYL